MSKVRKHWKSTELRARKLSGAEIFRWLLEKGLYPEAYVLPPCFHVGSTPPYSFNARIIAAADKRWFEPLSIGFPKTKYTDRRFSIVSGDVYHDLAAEVADHWQELCDALFHPDNSIASYSFPLPVNTNKGGSLSGPRSGRMIYEWVGMAENDLVIEAHNYAYIGRTDIKNFYPSIYTHAIAWALHGKEASREKKNRNSPHLLGNRLDWLFQRMNDGKTNGIPIGPAVSDLIAELILSAVDRTCSSLLRTKRLEERVLIVRFKDDYRILAKSEQDGQAVVKALQESLSHYNLDLHDGKTDFAKLPQGLFRPWKSRYHAANPAPREDYDFVRFKEVYLAVIEIERDFPGTGVIDRFLSDLVSRPEYTLRLRLTPVEVERAVSLLLMLAEHRSKAFPMVLAILGELGRGHSVAERKIRGVINSVLIARLDELSYNEAANKYQIIWLVYFIRTYGGKTSSLASFNWKDDLVRAVATSRWKGPTCKGLKTFEPVKVAHKRASLLEHLDVFRHDG